MCLRYEFASEWETVVLNKLHWITVTNNKNKSTSCVNSRRGWFPLRIDQGQCCVLELKQSNFVDHEEPWPSFLANELPCCSSGSTVSHNCSFLLSLPADVSFTLWLLTLPRCVHLVLEAVPPVPEMSQTSGLALLQWLKSDPGATWLGFKFHFSIYHAPLQNA